MSMTSEEAAARLKPSRDAFEKLYIAGKLKELAQYYHKEAVVVESGKKAIYGPEAIIKSTEEMDAALGKSDFSMQNEKYEGVGDFIHLEADYELKTEKAGPLKGHILQIWRKQGDGYVIYHDEYKM